jgi:clan AA aspartic protease (TIGR02281 family)
MKSLRDTKVKADKESKARHVIELQIATKKKIMKDADKEWHELETKLGVITDVSIHNRVVTRMNRLVADHKQAMADEKELEEQAGKTSMVAKTKFVDDVAAIAPKIEAVQEQYKKLGDDATVKANLAKAKGTLGPSAAFAAAAADVKKWQSEVESEAIPLREDGGIHMVDVLLNGEHFLMGVDTGASEISLPGDVAEKLKIIPGEQDPIVQMQLADGNIVQGKEMTIKTVRVGRFTLEEVRCVVMSKDLTHAPLILGGSFLNHYIVKLDPAHGELHLTEIKEEGTGAAKPIARPVSPAGK